MKEQDTYIFSYMDAKYKREEVKIERKRHVINIGNLSSLTLAFDDNL